MGHMTIARIQRQRGKSNSITLNKHSHKRPCVTQPRKMQEIRVPYPINGTLEARRSRVYSTIISAISQFKVPGQLIREHLKQVAAAAKAPQPNSSLLVLSAAFAPAEPELGPALRNQSHKWKHSVLSEARWFAACATGMLQDSHTLTPSTQSTSSLCWPCCASQHNLKSQFLESRAATDCPNLLVWLPTQPLAFQRKTVRPFNGNKSTITVSFDQYGLET